MKKEIFQKIEIPKEVGVIIEGNTLNIKGVKGESKRAFNIINIEFKKDDNAIIIGSKTATKREKKKINTIVSYVKNMIKGVQEGFEYKLKICYSHFPISVEIKGNRAIIKNFLGEKKEREVKIPSGVDVRVDKEIIIINSVDKELAGQTAANFETATKIRMRDRRIFQDGIFIINKAGKEI